MPVTPQFAAPLASSKARGRPMKHLVFALPSQCIRVTSLSLWRKRPSCDMGETQASRTSLEEAERRITRALALALALAQGREGVVREDSRYVRVSGAKERRRGNPTATHTRRLRCWGGEDACLAECF